MALSPAGWFLPSLSSDAQADLGLCWILPAMKSYCNKSMHRNSLAFAGAHFLQVGLQALHESILCVAERQ